MGIQKALLPQWLGRAGSDSSHHRQCGLQGGIWDDADPKFDNHRYSYKERQTRMAVKGKLLFDHKTLILTPWVSGSAGIGFNRARHFDNWPVIFEALPDPNFSNHTETGFTYVERRVATVFMLPLASGHWL